MLRSIFVLVAAFSFFVGSAYATAESVPMKKPAAIQMLISEVATVTFESNPTTGYSWVVENNGKSKVIQIVSHSYVPNFNPKHFVGSGGVEVWKFKAQKKGTETFTFKYVRPWKKDVVPLRTRQLSFVVQKYWTFEDQK